MNQHASGWYVTKNSVPYHQTTSGYAPDSDIKSLIPTFGKDSLIMLTHCNRPKVVIKLLKISYVRISFLVSLLFVAVINPYSVF